MTSIYRALASSPTLNAIPKGVSKSRVTPDSYHSTLSIRDNLTMCFLSRATELFWSTLRASYIHTEISDISTGLLHPTQKFRISLRVSYTHIEISDNSTSLLYPHRNFGFLHGSLTPTQRFRITPRVSYTHTEISDFSSGLLHPHRNFE